VGCTYHSLWQREVITEEEGPESKLMRETWPVGEEVYNNQGEKLGDIEALMLDVENSRVVYVVLSFGGFVSIANKLFAVPWDALTLELETLETRFILDVEKQHLESAPGFDKDNWPDMSDGPYARRVQAYYKVK
jgi:hypothetical protein